MKAHFIYSVFHRNSMNLYASIGNSLTKKCWGVLRSKDNLQNFWRMLFLCLIPLTYSKSTAQSIDPSSIISVEFKTGAADQGIPFFPDILFGASASDVVDRLNAMHVNTLRIPISLPMDPERVAILVDFVRKMHNNGGQNMAILLSQRKWNLHLPSQQDSWSDDISNAYNGIANAGFGNMVKGCIFDENTALDGAQSSKALWDLRHQGVLDAMTKLNNKTNNAFKTRTVFIHGKGYGSQFLGVKASSNGLQFPSQMSSRCSNYAYNFKFFQVGDPSDKSLAGWTAHYKNYCKLTEVFELSVPVMFVGDAGDGLRPNSFVAGKNPYGGPGQYVVKALRDIFAEYNWTGFSVGPFIRENATDIQQTVLYSVNNGQLTARQGQIDAWNTWYETTRFSPCDVNITPYVRINGGAWSTNTSQSIDEGGTLDFGPQSTAGAWSWAGPNGFTATTREISVVNISSNQAGAYTVTHVSNTGCVSTETFNITVNSNSSFSPNPNKSYYIDAPHHNLRLAANGESEDAYTTSTNTTGDDVAWKFVDNGNGSWYIERAAGGSKPRLRSDNSANADMNPSSSSGAWTFYDFAQGSISGTYFLTLPNGPLDYKRLQIDNTGNVKMVEETRNGTWESFAITEVSGSPTNNTFTIQENETGFCDVEGAIQNNHTGYSGTGFANATNTLGSGVDWEINGAAGPYTFTWKYANTSNRPANLIINGSTVVSNIAFNPTGAWTSWSTTQPITVDLAAGTKTVRLQSTANPGLANIDYMQVMGPSAAASGCSSSRSREVLNKLSPEIETLSLYPNPLTNARTLNINIPGSASVKADIISLSGEVMVSGNLDGGTGSMKLDHLDPGIFILKVTTDKNSYFEKIFIQ